MRLPHGSGRAGFWLAAWGIWLVALWFLSAGNPLVPGGPEIPFGDKIAHFGYFFGGGGLLGAGLFCRNPGVPAWRLVMMVALVSAAVGGLDEWHQTFTPGRSGNDPWDWLADLLGGTTGAVVFWRLRHRLRKSGRTGNPQSS